MKRKKHQEKKFEFDALDINVRINIMAGIITIMVLLTYIAFFK